MAKQSQKSKDKNTEILHVINNYAQTLRSRSKRVEMLIKEKSLKITFKISNERLSLTFLLLSLTLNSTKFKFKFIIKSGTKHRQLIAKI